MAVGGGGGGVDRWSVVVRVELLTWIEIHHLHPFSKLISAAVVDYAHQTTSERTRRISWDVSNSLHWTLDTVYTYVSML